MLLLRQRNWEFFEESVWLHNIAIGLEGYNKLVECNIIKIYE